MKKVYLMLLALVASVVGAAAQCEYAPAKADSVRGEDRWCWLPVEARSRRAQSLFMEIAAGDIARLSLNYDRRFSRCPDGLGWRAGVSYMEGDDDSMLSLPLGLNYLLGKKGHYFELGISAIPYYRSYRTLRAILESPIVIDPWTDRPKIKEYVDEQQRVFGVLGSLTMGYRSQPVKGGFVFGAGLTPTFGMWEGQFKFIPYWPYVNFGYTF